MTSTLTTLRYSGRPNPTTTIAPFLARQLWALLDELPVAIVAIDLCWKCLDAIAPLTADTLITRTEGEFQDWAFLTGKVVITRRGSHLQTDALRSLVSQLLLPVASPVAAARTLHEPAKAKAKAKADWRRCHHGSGHHAGDDIASCRCGSPADASTWLPAAICLSSNCYNFAVKDVWCQGAGGVPVGATPAGVPSPIDDYAAWSVILSGDGLIPVADYTVIPAGLSGGWHVALAVNTTDFHFLRLDGAHWSQKYGPRPPQTCDASGAAIPANGIDAADLCDYQLVGYFYVPHALAIDH